MRYSLLIVCLFTAFQLSFTCLYSLTYTVTSTADAGPGTLREAITLANGSPGADVINFDFGVAGVKTITLLSDLPDITDQLFIDGSSDPFYAGAPLVEINVNGQNNGLEVTWGGDFSHIHALILNNATFNTNSKAIEVTWTDDVRITGCYVGTDATGTGAIPNTRAGIYAYFANRVIIGGTGANEGNLISGNGDFGIYCWFADDAMIYGNKVGTDLTGTNSLPNGSGIYLWDCRGGIIGGTTAAHRNLVSGNINNGINLNDKGGHKIYGNYVGTDISGTFALPNAIGVQVATDSTEIGGALPGQENLISGNRREGLTVSFTVDSKVQGNFIGTDVSGTLALPNQREGIYVNGATRTMIGGNTAAERNLVSGNLRNGVYITRSDSSYVYANYIGTDISGNNPLPNQINGIEISYGSNTYIGNGTAAGANIISASGTNGILMGSSSLSPEVDSTIIKYNYIGTDPTGLINLANTGYGIRIQNGSQGNVIGGSNIGEGNFIANNLLGGVYINGANATENQIQRNSIYDHPQPGIRLNGGNNDQEAPVLTGYAAGMGTTTIFGTLNSAPNTTYRLEFFASTTATQGKTFMGATTISTDATGFYALNEVVPATLTALEPVVTATATDPSGNTSAFGIETILNAQFSSFDAEVLPLGKALLSWDTETQDPGTYFEVEHQAPNTDFILIGKQDQYVGLNPSRLYQYEVENLLAGRHYFRVAQVSEGGLRRYSRSLELEIEAAHQVLLPNPISNGSVVNISLQNTQSVQIHMLDMNGRKVRNLFVGEIEGGAFQAISLEDLGTLSKGMYVLRIEGVDFSMNQKVLLE